MKYPPGKATRDAFGDVLVAIGEQNQDVIVIDPDLAKSTKTQGFADRFPERFIEVGIAEANMIGIAAGLASCGKIPVTASFACFVLGRAFDQIRVSVSFADLNVKLIGTHGGISPGEDGPTQQSVEDIALALALPGMVVLVPCDEKETHAAVRAAIEHKGPVYIRLGRPKARIVYQAELQYQIGKADVLREGKHGTIITNGHLVAEALEAAENIEARTNARVGVINMSSVRPIDEDAIITAARNTGRILVAEEHLRYAGLGGEVARVVAEHCPVPMRFIGLEGFAESGTKEDLFVKYGLDAANIQKEMMSLLETSPAVG